jgi:hypothetical protein
MVWISEVSRLGSDISYLNHSTITTATDLLAATEVHEHRICCFLDIEKDYHRKHR